MSLSKIEDPFAGLTPELLVHIIEFLTVQDVFKLCMASPSVRHHVYEYRAAKKFGYEKKFKFKEEVFTFGRQSHEFFLGRLRNYEATVITRGSLHFVGDGDNNIFSKALDLAVTNLETTDFCNNVCVFYAQNLKQAQKFEAYVEKTYPDRFVVHLSHGFTPSTTRNRMFNDDYNATLLIAYTPKVILPNVPRLTICLGPPLDYNRLRLCLGFGSPTMSVVSDLTFSNSAALLADQSFFRNHHLKPEEVYKPPIAKKILPVGKFSNLV